MAGNWRWQLNISQDWHTGSGMIHNRLDCVNSSTPIAAYKRRWNGSPLVQMMVCSLHGAKSLSEPMLTYCQLEPKEHISIKLCLKFKYFHARKCALTCHQRNSGHFVQREIHRNFPDNLSRTRNSFMLVLLPRFRSQGRIFARAFVCWSVTVRFVKPEFESEMQLLEGPV